MDKLKSIAGMLLGVVIFVGIVIATILLFTLGAKVAFIISPFINWLASVLLFVNLVLLLVAIIPKARGFVGLVIYISSYIYGMSAWIFGLAVTLALWGWLAVIIGLFLGGVGVVPIGMLAAIFNGQWGIFWTLLFTIVLTYGARVVGYALTSSADASRKSNEVIDIEPEYETKRVWGDLE
jgi:hypothetical protein